MNIYVSNLSFQIESDDLRSYFEEYGEVTAAKVITDRLTGKSRGFGFVEMSDDTAANKAIEALNGAVADGRAMNVAVAKPKEANTNSRPSNSWR